MGVIAIVLMGVGMLMLVTFMVMMMRIGGMVFVAVDVNMFFFGVTMIVRSDGCDRDRAHGCGNAHARDLHGHDDAHRRHGVRRRGREYVLLRRDDDRPI